MTPAACPSTAGPSTIFWLAVILLGILAVLIVAALATGKIRLDPKRTRRSAGRAAISLDAAFAPKGRKEALEHLLDDQHTIVMEDPRGDGDPDGEDARVLFRYVDTADGEPDDAD
jgi:hypothetical protein